MVTNGFGREHEACYAKRIPSKDRNVPKQASTSAILSAETGRGDQRSYEPGSVSASADLPLIQPM